MYLENTSEVSMPMAAKVTKQSPRCKYKHIQPMVEQFRDSDAVVVKVVFTSYEYKNVASARACLHRIAKRIGLGVRTIVEDDVLFLIKKEVK